MIYKLVTRVIQCFCFPERPMKGGDILDFKKGPPSKILGPPLNLAPAPNLIFCSGPPQLFWSEIFRCPLPPKIREGGCYHVNVNIK